MSLSVAYAQSALVDALEDDGILAPFEGADGWSMASRRLPEIAVEQLSALDLLAEADMWRPAYAQLRGLLECLATILWIARGPDDASARFLSGRSLTGQKLLGAVGWRDEYQGTYRYLSRITHPGPEGAETYRTYGETRSLSEPAFEITGDGELYIVGREMPDGFAVPTRGTPAHALREEHEPYLTAKAFDLVLDALQRLSENARAHSKSWWPTEGLLVFEKCLEEHPQLADRMCYRPASGERFGAGRPPDRAGPSG
jgi:hypothetical protein